MNKPASFSDMKRVNKLSYNDFNRWVFSLYNSAYYDGLKTGNWASDESIFDILCRNGIDTEKACKICDEILKIDDECPYVLEV